MADKQTGQPTLLTGHGAIAAHVGISRQALQHLIRVRRIPVWTGPAGPIATTGALDEWQAARSAHEELR